MLAAIVRRSLCLCVVAAASAAAQQPSRARGEGRIDYLGPSPHALHAAAGVNLPVGTYLRLGLIGGGGTAWASDRQGVSARVDVIARFALDPFRERRWGLSAGGGFSVRYDEARTAGRRWRPLLTLAAELEGPRWRGSAPAVQVGLGGGVRIGLILRSAGRDRR